MRILSLLPTFILAVHTGVVAQEYTVGIVVFDDFLTSEVAGPVEVFAKAASKGPIRFQPVVVGSEKRLYTSEEGLTVQADHDFASCPRLDVLLVPSALHMEEHLADEKLISFIRERAANAKFLGSNCAGAFLLGQAGLLKGRRVTTYVSGVEELRKRFPEAQVVDTERVVVDGNLVTSVGGLVTYDATLTLLEKIGGRKLSEDVARALYYFPWLERPNITTP